MKQIICNCTELREVDLSFIPIPPDTLDYLAKNLTPKIKRLNLYYQQELTDEHVNALVSRCNKITDLNSKFGWNNNLQSCFDEHHWKLKTFFGKIKATWLAKYTS